MVVSLLQCLIYRLVFIIGKCIQEKAYQTEFSTFHGFRAWHPPGILECVLWRRELLHSFALYWGEDGYTVGRLD